MNFSDVGGSEEVGNVNISVFLIPIVLFICVAMMVVAIVGIVHWSKARDKELQYHQDLRIREMEHQLKMKGLEVELEKAKQKSV